MAVRIKAGLNIVQIWTNFSNRVPLGFCMGGFLFLALMGVVVPVYITELMPACISGLKYAQ